MEPLTIGIVGVAVFFFLILTGVPIAFTALIVGIFGIGFLSGFDVMAVFGGYMPYAVTYLYTLGLLPLFILMGYFAFYGGLTKDMYDTARKWFGHLPGGLAIATTFGAAGFGAATGSSVASAGVFGRIAVPELRASGYDPKFACAVVASSGTMAAMIPPSILLVIYGMLAEQSVAILLIAGILPGIMEAVSYATLILVKCKTNPALGKGLAAASWKERFVSLRGIWGIVVLIALVIGGLFFGLFTPNEAGAMGALGSLAIALVRRGLNWTKLKQTFVDTARTSGMLLLLLAGILVFTRFLALSGVSTGLTRLIIGLPIPSLGVLLIVLLFGLVYGFFLSGVGLLMLLVPIFLPVIEALGVHPILFGILLIRVTEAGMITPPVGLNCFVVKSVVPDVPLEDIFKGIMPFFVVDVINIALLVAFPSIALFLPGLMRS